VTLFEGDIDPNKAFCCRKVNLPKK